MRKALIFILSAVFMFAMAGTASAKSGSIQPVHINIDGKPIPFELAPTLVNNKMYVEAGMLLKELGFEYGVEEATGIISASSEDREIQLAPGRDIAIVNGWTVDSPGEVIEQDGLTLLGVRFIASLAGYSVEWDKPTRTALLVNEGPNAEERAALYELFNRMLLIEASGDATGLAALFTADTPLDVKAIQDQWVKTKTTTKIVRQMVDYYSDDEAVVTVYDETKKVSGAFYPDHSARTQYTLHRAEDGSWSFYSFELLEMQITDLAALYDQEVTIPEADKAEIGKLLEDQLKAANEENLDAYMATMAPSGLYEETRLALEELFAAADSTVDVDRWAIVEYDAAGTAKLLATLTTDVNANGEKFTVRTVAANDLEKVDGKWLFSTEPGMLLHQEQL